MSHKFLHRGGVVLTGMRRWTESVFHRYGLCTCFFGIFGIFGVFGFSGVFIFIYCFLSGKFFSLR